MQNSDRFIDAFKAIESHLRTVTRKERNVPFNELIDIAKEQNRLVKTHERILKRFGYLRNEISHEGKPIAEPNDWAVETIEKIKSHLTDPPKVLQTPVKTLSADETIDKALKMIYEDSFSQIPIYEGGNFVGLLTTNTVARWLGAQVQEDIFSLSETSIRAVLGYSEDDENVSFLGRNSTLLKVIEKFQDYQQRGKRLEAVLITESGKRNETPVGIITAWDLPRIYRDLDLFTS